MSTGYVMHINLNSCSGCHACSLSDPIGGGQAWNDTVVQIHMF